MSEGFDERLRRVALFENLSPDELKLLAMVLREETYEPGHVVCTEGEPGRCCYFIAEGEIDVTKRLGEDEDRVLATLRRGNLFGQIALIDAGPRSASCRARTRASVFRLDRQDFDTLFSSGSRFAFRFQLAIAQLAAGQLREANRKLNLLLTTSKRRTPSQRDRLLSEVQDILARSDVSTADIRWID